MTDHTARDALRVALAGMIRAIWPLEPTDDEAYDGGREYRWQLGDVELTLTITPEETTAVVTGARGSNVQWSAVTLDQEQVKPLARALFAAHLLADVDAAVALLADPMEPQ